MSIDKFTAAMQARIGKTASKESSHIVREFGAYAKSLEASWDPEFDILKRADITARQAASQLLVEKRIEPDLGNKKLTKKQREALLKAPTRYGSLFRTIGEQSGNTVFEADEYNLSTLFDFFNLRAPFGGILNNYIYWLQNTKGKYEISRKNVIDKKTKKAVIDSITNKPLTKPEYYTKNQINTSDLEFVYKESDPTDIAGILQSNIRHQSTGKQMYAYLKDMGLSYTYPEYAKLIQVGHIESQAHLKLKISRDAYDSTAYDNGLIDQLIALDYYLDIVSSSLTIGNPEMRAAIAKIHRPDADIKVIVQMQIAGIRHPAGSTLSEITSNQGSGGVSSGLNIPALLRGAVSTSGVEDGVILPPGHRRKIVRDIKRIAAALETIKANFLKHKKIITDTFNAAGNIDPNFLINLESSDSVKTIIKNQLIGVLTDKTIASIDVKHNNILLKKINTNNQDKAVKELRDLARKSKQEALAIKAEARAKAKIKDAPERPQGPVVPRLRTQGGQFTSLVSIQNILNQNLHTQIQKNMGTGDRRDILNYRTGRFAESVKVERMSQSREGMITAFYSYMRNPYATFSFGGAQSSPATRDPKLLISRSIREIGATMVGNRMRAVLV